MQLSMPLTLTHAGFNNTVGLLANDDGLTYASCGLQYFNLTVSYNPSTNGYYLLTATPSNDYFTSVLLGPLMSQLASERLAADVQSAILVGDNTTFNAILGQDLARMAVAWPSALFSPIPAEDTVTVEVRAFGAYPMAPVIIITLLLYLYSIVALSVFVTARTFISYNVDITPADTFGGSRKMAAVALGQKWLTNPLPLVAMAFPENDGMDAKRSIAPTSLEMINDLHDERLSLGLHPNAFGETAFTLRRRGGAGTETRKRSGSF